MSDEPEPPAHEIEGSAVEEPDGPGTDLVAAPQNAGVVIAGATPQAVLETVGQLSTALSEFIEKQNLAASMGGGKKHVEIGGWQALGHLLGTLGGTPTHAETVWARPLASPTGEVLRVEYRALVKTYHRRDQGGGLKSETTYDVAGIEAWEASVRICTPDGTIVGVAEAMCSRFEAKWGTRDDYALRSQAETRAGSRAFRTALGWIIHAAGYSPTPREEMPDAAEMPQYVSAANAAQIENMGRGLAFLLQETEPAERVTLVLERLRRSLASVGVPDGEIPRLVTTTVLALASAVRDLQAEAHAAEAAPERPPLAAVPDEPAPLEPTKDRGSVPTPRLSGNEDDDIALMRERGCVCRAPLDPRTWRVDCPIKKHHENPDIPF